LCDFMARVHWIKRAGYDLRDFSHVILRHGNLPFQLETLKKLGLSDAQLIPHTESLHIEAEALIVPSFFNVGFGCDHTSYRYEGLRGVRDFFLSGNPYMGADVNYPKRIYVTRQRAKVRRVLNGDALEDCLREFGFTSIALEELALVEQAALFARAEAVIGPHGAGFTNVIFCDPGTRILEMFHPDFISPNFWDCSTTLGLDYQALVTSDPPVHSPFFKFRQEANMTIDLTGLRATLRAWRF